MTWRQGDTCRASTPWWCSRTSRNRCAMLSWREPFWASEILWDASIPGGSETQLLGLKMFFLLHLCDALLLQCCFSRLSIGTHQQRVKDVKVTHQAFSFTKMMREWSYPSPYWFEEHDLRPTGAIFHQTPPSNSHQLAESWSGIHRWYDFIQHLI